MEYYSPEYAKNFIKKMSDEDWRQLRNKIIKMGKKSYRNRLKTASIDIEDVFQKTVTDTMEGKRQWPVGIDFTTYTMQVMKSIIGHIAKRKMDMAKLHKTVEEYESDPIIPKELFKCPDDDSKIYYSEIFKMLFKMLMQRVQPIPELNEILELLMTQPDLKPGEIALFLGMDVSEINNRLKRLRRLAKAVREESPI